jgi:D-alanyl-D-alanine carboxypeptidase
MTNHDSSRNTRQGQRFRHQNMTLMAIAVTFVLLLLVFAILLSINVVMALRDDPELPDDTEQTPPADNNPTPEDPDGNDTPDIPTSPEDNVKTETVSSDQINQGNLILVNLSHVYKFPASEAHLIDIYANQKLAQTHEVYYQLGGKENYKLYMETTAYAAMNKMLIEFSNQSGLTNVLMESAYRSYDYQKKLYDGGGSTPPGYSDSHAGLSCSLSVLGQTKDFATDESYRWIYDNCYKYGFVVRYPADKVGQTGVADYSNYFRYVGYVHAYVMKTKNLCLEEYIALLQSHTYGENALKVTTDDGSNYEIYYVSAVGTQTQVPVPENATYTISGDNEGGFIVTVKLS